MELKTLKDIDSAIDVNGVSDGLSVFVSDLQKEAIKWVKIYQEKRNLTNQIHEKTLYYGKIEGIRNFFNLTEDDLNKKEVKEK
jgi:hypothetical protein